MRVLLLHNPVAGDGEAGARRLQAKLAEHGHDARCQSTKERGWKRALRRCGELVVVAGGDGTVAKVLRRLDADAPPVAILPCGSANNIARGLGIDDDLDRWIAHWPRAALHCFARPQVRAAQGRRRFIEAVGLGVFPAVIAAPGAASARGAAKVTIGAELFAAAVRRAPAQCWRLELDGRAIDCEDAIMLEILNVPMIGPRLRLGDALVADGGSLEVAVVPAAARTSLAACVLGDGNAAGVPMARYRARHALIHPDGAPMHVDDEVWPRRRGRRALEVSTGGPPVRVLRPA